MSSVAPTSPSEGFKNAKYFIEKLRAENEVYVRELQAEAKAIWDKRGPLCDSEGFYQHTGECQSDAFQQILLNTDTIKEKIQNGLIHIDFNSAPPDLPDTLFSYERFSFFGAGGSDYITENYDLIQQQKQWALLYLREVQKRFLRHYITEAGRRNLKEELCSKGEQPADLAVRKLSEISRSARARRGGKEAQHSSIFGLISHDVFNRKRNARYRPNLETYTKNILGGTVGDTDLLLKIINHVFFSGESIESSLWNDSFLKDIKKLGLFERLLKSYPSWVAATVSIQRKGEAGHAMAFYTCGGKHFLYEDNKGIIEFNWPLFIERHMNILNEDKDYTVSFIAVKLYSKKNNFIQPYNFYPILTLTTDGIRKTLFLFGTEFIELDNQEDSFMFSFQRGDYEVSGKVNRPKDYVLNYYKNFSRLSSAAHNLDFQFDPRARIQQTPLYTLISFGDESKIVQFLESQPVTPDLSLRIEGQGNFPLLHILITSLFDTAAKTAIEKGYAYDFTIKGFPPIFWAAKRGLSNTVLALIEKNAGLDVEDAQGLNVFTLSMFFMKNPRPILEELFKKGFDINGYNKQGFTPLHVAVAYKSLEAINLLCEMGADPNKPDGKEGDITPLDLAEGKAPEIQEALKNCALAKKGGRRTRRVKKRRSTKKSKRN